MPVAQFNYGGNIVPNRFVMIDTSLDNTVIQATANAVTLGVSQSAEDSPPYSTLQSGFAGTAGRPGAVMQDEIALLEVGAAVTRGASLKSDSQGRGIAVTTAADFVGAIALESAGAAGVKIRAKLVAFRHA